MKPITNTQPQDQICQKPNIQTDNLQLDNLSTKEVGNRPPTEPTQNDNDNLSLTAKTETNNKPIIKKRGNFAHVIID